MPGTTADDVCGEHLECSEYSKHENLEDVFEGIDENQKPYYIRFNQFSLEDGKYVPHCLTQVSDDRGTKDGKKRQETNACQYFSILVSALARINPPLLLEWLENKGNPEHPSSKAILKLKNILESDPFHSFYMVSIPNLRRPCIMGALPDAKWPAGQYAKSAHTENFDRKCDDPEIAYIMSLFLNDPTSLLSNTHEKPDLLKILEVLEHISEEKDNCQLLRDLAIYDRNLNESQRQEKYNTILDVLTHVLNAIKEKGEYDTFKRYINDLVPPLSRLNATRERKFIDDGVAKRCSLYSKNGKIDYKAAQCFVDSISDDTGLIVYRPGHYISCGKTRDKEGKSRLYVFDSMKGFHLCTGVKDFADTMCASAGRSFTLHNPALNVMVEPKITMVLDDCFNNTRKEETHRKMLQELREKTVACEEEALESQAEPDEPSPKKTNWEKLCDIARCVWRYTCNAFTIVLGFLLCKKINKSQPANEPESPEADIFQNNENELENENSNDINLEYVTLEQARPNATEQEQAI